MGKMMPAAKKRWSNEDVVVVTAAVVMAVKSDPHANIANNFSRSSLVSRSRSVLGLFAPLLKRLVTSSELLQFLVLWHGDGIDAQAEWFGMELVRRGLSIEQPFDYGCSCSSAPCTIHVQCRPPCSSTGSVTFVLVNTVSNAVVGEQRKFNCKHALCRIMTIQHGNRRRIRTVCRLVRYPLREFQPGVMPGLSTGSDFFHDECPPGVANN